LDEPNHESASSIPAISPCNSAQTYFDDYASGTFGDD